MSSPKKRHYNLIRSRRVSQRAKANIYNSMTPSERVKFTEREMVERKIRQEKYIQRNQEIQIRNRESEKQARNEKKVKEIKGLGIKGHLALETFAREQLRMANKLKKYTYNTISDLRLAQYHQQKSERRLLGEINKLSSTKTMYNPNGSSYNVGGMLNYSHEIRELMNERMEHQFRII